MVFSCKMCGASLNVQSGMRICKCDYCDSVQTIPDLSSEKKLQLFNKANSLRFACDFDRASDIYSDIVTDFPEEAEAYWGLCLCKYGIEYVVDPETQNRVPTCHRTSFERIQDIPEFRKVLEYSDVNLRNIYIQLAEVIDNIQQGILAIAVNEKPFDVFICYKETDENGSRSADALLAEKIYSVLTQQNINVFFAPVTLKDKLGTEFEPYIYSAINSAQIMVCVGTSAEHFDSVWVRNEWSRFIELMKKDRTKILIPCYSEMTINQLPVEFRGFQAQNLADDNAFSNILKSVQDIMTASEGAKSQLNVLMEKFEGQLRNERSKLRVLENIHHQQMIHEKQNAQKMFKKERFSPALILILEFLLFTLTLLITISSGVSGYTVFISVLIALIVPLIFLVPYAYKRNKKARENLNRRLAYDENANGFDYIGQDSEISALRLEAMNEYEKKRITFGKAVGLYFGIQILLRLFMLFTFEIIDISYQLYSDIKGVIQMVVIVGGIIFISSRNAKLKKELNEKLDIINRKNKV